MASSSSELIHANDAPPISSTEKDEALKIPLGCTSLSIVRYLIEYVQMCNMHIHTPTHTQTYTYIHTCRHMLQCMHICIYIYSCIYIYILCIYYISIYVFRTRPSIYLYIIIYTYIYACIHTRPYIYIYTYKHMCMYTYIHTYIHTYIYILTNLDDKSSTVCYIFYVICCIL